MKSLSFRKAYNALICFLAAAFCTAGANCVYFLFDSQTVSFVRFAVCCTLIGIASALLCRVNVGSARLFFVGFGSGLLKVFLITLVFSVVWHIILLFLDCPDFWHMLLISVLVCVISLNAVFWIGMILVYALSLQMGLRHRVVGILLGFIPIANIIMLFKIIHVADGEVDFESERKRLNRKRHGEQICKTKYPILLVHGVFFRDFKHINYWGRIPADLEKNGACIYYGEQNSASSVEDSGKELSLRIKKIVEETGCEKVNIIAHSKGGLDSRAAIAAGADKYVASLTTINTPHLGCQFADYLLNIATDSLKEKVSRTYNAAAAGLGDKNPDFMAAVSDLTAERCAEFNEKYPSVPEEIYTHCVMSKMKNPISGKFPLNFTYLLAKHFDGDGDGLVAVENARFGDNFTLVLPKSGRGISHGDMVDLNRENIPGFDVREFYVGIVSDLKKRGL